MPRARRPAARCTLRAAHLRRRPGRARPRLRAVHEPLPRRAARHRHRRGVRPPRGHLPRPARPLRRRPRRVRLHGRDVQGAHGDPRGRQGAGHARGRGRLHRQVLPARARRRRARGAWSTCPSCGGCNLDRADLGLLFDVVERLDGFPRHIALHPSGVLLADAGRCATSSRSSAPPPGSRWRSSTRTTSRRWGCASSTSSRCGCCRRWRTRSTRCARTRGESSWTSTTVPVRRPRHLRAHPVHPHAGHVPDRVARASASWSASSSPSTSSDLVVDISLFRPGPVKGDMVGPFLQPPPRRAKATHIPHPLLERALGETFGVIVYHEQVMRCVAAATGCDLATADLVRRRLGDPERARRPAAVDPRRLPPERGMRRGDRRVAVARARRSSPRSGSARPTPPRSPCRPTARRGSRRTTCPSSSPAS